MKPVIVEAEIAAAPAHVFGVFTDLARAPERIRGIDALELLTPAPVGKGTRFKETRTLFGKSSSETMEIVDFRPGQGYTVTAESCGARYLSSFTFEPSGAGTRVRMSFQSTPVSFLARMLAPLLGLMAGSLAKCIRADLEDLKGFCEGRAAP
jgi:carbon monoxide dehydrogenase subunit G